jgi:hypothetical protein
MKLTKTLLSSMTLVGLSLGAVTADASLAIVSSVGGAPAAGVTKWNLDGPGITLAPGVSSLTFIGAAQAVTGSSSGLYAAPWLSGSNGTGFGPGGSNQANGVDTTQYFTTGSTGANVEVTFSTALQYLGLLWGSVDTYNTLTFFDGATNVGSITGSQVTPAATGDQGLNGTRYVNINSTLKFNRLVFSSSQYAFEFDNLAFGEKPITAVPIPAAAWLLGSGLLGLLGIGRRRIAR